MARTVDPKKVEKLEGLLKELDKKEPVNISELAKKSGVSSVAVKRIAEEKGYTVKTRGKRKAKGPKLDGPVAAKAPTLRTMTLEQLHKEYEAAKARMEKIGSLIAGRLKDEEKRLADLKKQFGK